MSIPQELTPTPNQAADGTSDISLGRVLRIAWPLMVGMALTAVMHGLDQVFLGHLPGDEGRSAIAAAFPAHITAYTAMCLFIGAAGFTGTFAAQHHGAGEDRDVGPMVWPGLQVAVLGGLLVAAMIPFREPIFALFGTEPDVLADLSNLGGWYFAQAMPASITAALLGYFGGLGRTGVIATIGGLAFVLNAGLNAVLMFGLGPFPRLGLTGAGLGTLIATWVTALAALMLFLRPRQREQFATDHWRCGWERVRRFVRFSLPHGARELTEVSAWQVFTIAVAGLGTASLSANNSVIRWSLLCFIPLIGLGQAIGILTGQAMGRGDREGAARAGLIGLRIGLAWAGLFAGAFLLIPETLLLAFVPAEQLSGLDGSAIRNLASQLFLIAALWGIADGITLCLRGVLTGAGDTTWPFWALLTLAIVVFAIPEIGLMAAFANGWQPPFNLAPITMAWLVALAFVWALALTMIWRFKTGHWRHMTVRIEQPSAASATTPDAAADARAVNRPEPESR